MKSKKDSKQSEKASFVYWPLVVVALTAFLFAMALSGHYVEWQLSRFMRFYMGSFFTLLAMFKFFDIRSFSEGFRLYDRAAQRYPSYASFYPFVELSLGGLYIVYSFPTVTNILTILIMGEGMYSVRRYLQNNTKEVSCACLGTALKIPLTKVSYFENSIMILMACGMLLL